MNALTASLVVTLVGVIAFLIVAIVTASTRIGRLPAIAAADSSGQAASALSESARHFRVLGWMTVLLLYLGAIFCVLQGFGDFRIFLHWDKWASVFGSELSDRAEIALYSRFWMATGIVLILVGLWAQWRLRRRAV